MATAAFQTPRREQTVAPRDVRLTETEKRQLLENLDIEGASFHKKAFLDLCANISCAFLQWRTKNDVSKPIFKISLRALRLDTKLKSLASPRMFER
jgi:hypothetical protein